MGMFSTLIHGGREYQFKTGHDDSLGRYRVGDRIDWEPDPYRPGSHVDGVHEALDVGHGPDVWVVVKDSTIVTIEHWGAGDYKTLEAKHGITEPDRSLWTEEQWAAKEAREAKAKADYEAWKAKHVTGDDTSDACSYFMRQKLQASSFTSHALPAKKVN